MMIDLFVNFYIGNLDDNVASISDPYSSVLIFEILYILNILGLSIMQIFNITLVYVFRYNVILF